MTTFASEIALIEADKEADRKYKELITEAENILVNMQRNHNTSPIVAPSPSRKFHNGLTNKRVELIKNTELNIELALSKSRNSQPELQSGSIKDLEHISPKRQFPQRNGNIGLSKETQQIKCPDSPLMSRKASHESLIKGLLQNKMRLVNDNLSRTQGLSSNYYEHGSPNLNKRAELTSIANSNARHIKTKNNCELEKKNGRISTPLKIENIASSSSDSEERCEDVDGEPLLNFRSV